MIFRTLQIVRAEQCARPCFSRHTARRCCVRATFTTDPVWAICWISIALSELAAAKGPPISSAISLGSRVPSPSAAQSSPVKTANTPGIHSAAVFVDGANAGVRVRREPPGQEARIFLARYRLSDAEAWPLPSALRAAYSSARGGLGRARSAPQGLAGIVTDAAGPVYVAMSWSSRKRWATSACAAACTLAT